MRSHGQFRRRRAVVRESAKRDGVHFVRDAGSAEFKDKSFCRLWGPRDASGADVGDAEVLVVFCEPDEKKFLLAEVNSSP